MHPQRAAVVAEARAWLRTPYHHQARLKGVGADCAQMPIAVYAAAGLIPPIETGVYSPQWMLHRSEELYLTHVLRLAREITLDAVGAGDFALWRFGRAFSHGAIVVDWPVIIHASLADACVCLADATRDADLPGRPVRFFSPWSAS